MRSEAEAVPPKEYLRAALEKERLPHALLFSGPQGSGQPETAAWLAQMLFCRQKKKNEPCASCGDCRLVANGAHPDLVWLRPEEDSRTIKVEGIRHLISRAGLKPLQAPSKLFVIEPADGMNDIAQNAFLKTLEEPEGRTHFVLISYANERLLATVRSRSQELRFRAQAKTAVMEEELESASRQIEEHLLGRANARRPELALSREEAATVLEAVMQDLREALLVSVGAESIAGNPGPRIAPLAERFSREELIAHIETLSEFKEKILQNVNVKLALSVLMENLCPASIS